MILVLNKRTEGEIEGEYMRWWFFSFQVVDK